MVERERERGDQGDSVCRNENFLKSVRREVSEIECQLHNAERLLYLFPFSPPNSVDVYVSMRERGAQRQSTKGELKRKREGPQPRFMSLPKTR